MTEPASEEVEKAVDAIYSYAAALLRAGQSPGEVEDALVAKGVERKTAMVIVAKLGTAMSGVKDERKAEGQKGMLIGALMCIVGIVITAATYSAASSSGGGGRYVVTWGLIVFGAIRFFRGLARSAG